MWLKNLKRLMIYNVLTFELLFTEKIKIENEFKKIKHKKIKP